MSRSLKSLTVGNFKAFADSQSIPIKPITLIFGPNSAGKSSFIHSVALAHEAQLGREKRSLAQLDVHHTDVGGSSIDLGGFRQYVHRAQLQRRVEWGAELKVSDLKNPNQRRLAELLEPLETVSLNIFIGIELDKDDHPEIGAVPRVESIEIKGDGIELMRMSRRKADSKGTNLRLDRLSNENPIFRKILKAIVESTTTSEEMLDDDFNSVDAVIANLLPELLVRVDKFFPIGVDVAKSDGSDFSSVNMLFPVSKENRGADIAQAVRFYLPRTLNELIKGLSDALIEEIKNFQYLGPLRSFPPRHLAFAEHEDTNWYAGGGYAWDQLRRNKTTRDAVNKWLGNPKLLKTPYQIVSRRLLTEGNGLTNLVDSIVEKVSSVDFSSAPSELIYKLQSKLSEAENRDVFHVYESSRRTIEMLNSRIKEKGAQLSFLNSEKHELVHKINWLRSEKKGEITNKRQLEIKSILEKYILQLDNLNQKLVENQIESDNLSKIQSENIEVEKMNVYAHEKRNAALRGLRELLEGFQEKFSEQINENLVNDNLNDTVITKEEDVEEMLSQGMDEFFPDALQDLKLIDVNKNVEVTHRDVGIGISQVLPVLVMAYGSSGKLLAMEQPEIHLHPAIQAELADVFIESALGIRQNTFILETHSEHIILRLLRRIREGSLKSEDICVVFVEPLSQGSRAIELRIDEDGDFIDEWPGGFFEESFHEKFGGR
jgi:predicted ATP-dependent endonuclease of OLD family